MQPCSHDPHPSHDTNIRIPRNMLTCFPAQAYAPRQDPITRFSQEHPPADKLRVTR
ncbi:hypothetical protein BS50DRAFT_577954 [Corynespora cassiicola Philippines]|uniref:Uncharacterized protein n=1 Tax=Corynespora cassiicola Philippines TaxID=1448308 RepID=A0A2T2NAM5_CORCC|nr:hypothetical protein BS50DRAFT_577954 [Corynespora cassiicola Philippines]